MCDSMYLFSKLFNSCRCICLFPPYLFSFLCIFLISFICVWSTVDVNIANAGKSSQTNKQSSTIFIFFGQLQFFFQIFYSAVNNYKFSVYIWLSHYFLWHNFEKIIKLNKILNSSLWLRRRHSLATNPPSNQPACLRCLVIVGHLLILWSCHWYQPTSSSSFSSNKLCRLLILNYGE